MTLFRATLRIKLSLPAATTLALPLALAGMALTVVRADHPISSRTVSISDMGRTSADIAKAKSAKSADDAQADEVIKGADSKDGDAKTADADQPAASTPDLSANSDASSADSPKELTTPKDPSMGHDGKPLTPELAALAPKSVARWPRISPNI